MIFDKKLNKTTQTINLQWQKMKKYLGETSHKRKHHLGDPFLRPILFAENRLPEVDVSLCIPKMAIGLYFSKWRNEEIVCSFERYVKRTDSSH